jgi:hypothetical protein
MCAKGIHFTNWEPLFPDIVHILTETRWSLCFIYDKNVPINIPSVLTFLLLPGVRCQLHYLSKV